MTTPQGLSLEDILVRTQNLKKGPKGLVGVFGKYSRFQDPTSSTKPLIKCSKVGGTSGIGEWTFRAFVKHTNSPRAYLIGRNKAVAAKIVSEAQITNPEANIEFIPADVSLLKEVSRVVQDITRKEERVSGVGKGKVNLLVLSQSSSGLGGRNGMQSEMNNRILCSEI